MVIGICDDDKIWLETAEKTIRDYCAKNEMDSEIYCFETGRELLKFKEKAPDVLFLDIRLEKENGIQVALQINEKWKDCQIVYLTDYLFYATEVYHTVHVFYVMKKEFENRITEVFEKIFHELEQKEKKLIFSVVKGGEIVLAPDEILYFEREKRITWLISTREKYKINMTLDELVKRLPELDFARCHNSFIVYLPAVQETGRDEFHLNNGIIVPISRLYRLSAREAFLRWARTQVF